MSAVKESPAPAPGFFPAAAISASAPAGWQPMPETPSARNFIFRHARRKEKAGAPRLRLFIFPMMKPGQLSSRMRNGSPPFGVSVTVALMPAGFLPMYSGRKRRSSNDSASVFSTWLIAPPMHERLPPPNGR